MKKALVNIQNMQQTLMLLNTKREEILEILKKYKIKLISDNIIINEFVYGYSFTIKINDLCASGAVADAAFKCPFENWKTDHSSIQVSPKNTLGVYRIYQEFTKNK